MTWFTLEPRDTLMVRDGRGMNAQIGRSLPMPHPPTLVGLLRTRLGTPPGGSFDKSRIDELLRECGCAGPLLARLSDTSVEEVFVPAPADCVWLRDDGGARAHRLRAQRVADALPGGDSDLGADAWLPFLQTAGGRAVGKPTMGPRFWSWSRFSEWLASDGTWPHSDAETGIAEFERERRIHVSIATDTLTASDGELFSTEGVRFCRAAQGGHGVSRWALLARATVPPRSTLERGLVTLGGERSTAFLEVQPAVTLTAPPEVARLRKGCRARVVLLTPAIFAEGAMPRDILGASVLTAAVDRPQVVSGWNFKDNRPKETRRMAPAGSVYWVEVPDDGWAERTWLATVSTAEQDRRDGFGLAAVGVCS